VRVLAAETRRGAGVLGWNSASGAKLWTAAGIAEEIIEKNPAFALRKQAPIN
jgi:hypothetical protein